MEILELKSVTELKIFLQVLNKRFEQRTELAHMKIIKIM